MPIRNWWAAASTRTIKVYGYDANSNATLQIQSQGTTDLRNVTSLDGALAATGVTRTYSIYNSRNEVIETRRPSSLETTGTYTSISDVAVASKKINVVQTDQGGNSTDGYKTNVQVSLSSQDITQVPGAGYIHVTISAYGGGTMKDPNDGSVKTSMTFNYPAGSVSLANRTITWPYSTNTQGYYYTVTVTQDVGTSTVTLLSSPQYYMQPLARDPVTHENNIGSLLQIQGVDTLASTVKLYVRPSGSGNYTLVNSGSSSSMSPLYDVGGNLVSGAFTCSFNQAPFTGATGTWDIVYQATDASGRVVEAKSGVIDFGAGALPTVSSPFTSIAVFTATAQSGGMWQLFNNSAPPAYVGSTQSFNAFGDIVSQVDANGNLTTLTYNVLGNLVQKTAAAVTSVGESGLGVTVNPTNIYYYDKSGRQIGHRDANGNLTTQLLLAGTGYGGAAALTTTQYNADGGSVTTTYDIFGNAVTVTDAIGAVTMNTYDNKNRLITVAHAIRANGTQLIDSYTYDGLGQRLKHTNNVLGTAAETTDYDLLGRVVKTVSFGSQATNYNYTWNAMTATGVVTAGQASIGAWTRTTSAWGKTSSDVTDYFGKLVWSSDFGGHQMTYIYNLAGRLASQTNSDGGQLDYTYTAGGQVATVTDYAHRDYASNATEVAASDTAAAATVTLKAVYAYDNNGNRVRQTLFKVGTTPIVLENASITYDGLNRVTQYKDSKTDITYSYDANGNRRNVLSKYRIRSGTTTTNNWYKYDSMNRFVLTGGVLSGSVIEGGVLVSYNARGERKTATYAHDGHVESYNYSADGFLETVSIAVKSNGVLGASALRVNRTNDAMGRNTWYEEKNDTGTTLLTRQMTYDADNRVAEEWDYTYGTNNGTAVTYSSHIVNHYKLLNAGQYNGQDIGVLTHSQSDQFTGGTASGTTQTTYDYHWWGSAKTATVTASGQTTGSSVYSYDAEGYLYKLEDTGANRKIFYQTNMFGQVLARKEWNMSGQTGNYLSGAGREFFYLNGNAIGDIGTDALANRIDYAQQLANDKAGSTSVTQSWTSYNTATPVLPNPVANANIDYEAYNASTIDQSIASFTARGGETLSDAAFSVWGDASLWYVLAEANGLTASATLVTGQVLRVPAKSTNIHNNASTFKPFDPAEGLGNTKPSQPQPPVRNQGCGTIGQMLVVIIAVVVTAIVAPYATAAVANAATAAGASAAVAAGVGAVAGGAIAGFAGGVVSQTFAVATGIQSKFDWTSVAMGAIAGGVGGGFGTIIKGSTFLAGAARGLATSVVSQGVNMAVGLQKSFNWTSVAVAGVTGGVGAKIGGWAQSRFGEVGGGALAGSASALAGAATHSILTGQSFGKSLKEALPGAIGTTIGNMIGGAIVGAMGRIKSADDGIERQMKISAKEVARLERQRNTALRKGDTHTADLHSAQIHVLSDPNLITTNGMMLYANDRYGDRASVMTVEEVMGSQKSKYISVSKTPTTISEQAEFDPDVITITGRRPSLRSDSEGRLVLKGESTLGRVAVNAAVYTKEKIESVPAPVREGAIAGVKAVVTGGIAPIIQFGIDQGVNAAIPYLPNSVLEPLAKASSRVNEFIGDRAAGFALDIDHQAVNSRDSEGTSFFATAIIGISAGKILSKISHTVKERGGAESEPLRLSGPKQIALNKADGGTFQNAVQDSLRGVENRTAVTLTLADGRKVTTIPDLWGAKTGVLDVKKVQSLSFTEQLKAQYQLALDSGQQFNLVVSPGTKTISLPLQRAVAATGGKFFEFNPTTGSWANVVLKGNKVVRP
jgi:YD repeat-containing protein